MTIKSGYTLAIGGLIEKVTGKGDSKVPVLGDIPYLGRLFSSENNTTDRRNLIVFITAKILSASGATYQDVFSNQKLHQMGVNPTDVPGYELSDAEKELTDKVMKSRENAENMQKELELRQELMLLDSIQQGTQSDIENQEAVEEGKSYPKRNFGG